MKILIVGFGNMGCRHAQSLLQSNNKNLYYVIEPDKEVFLRNIERIGAIENQFTWFESLADLPDNIDFVIVATSAYPRYQITKDLINKGIKFYLLEKIVFQSKSQFDEIIQLLDNNNCKAYCNFVNRYFPNYIEIKQNLDRRNKVIMNVLGGDFGLGCNALHYIDLFEYMTQNETKLCAQNLIVNPKGNRRGANYKELLGELRFETIKGDMLNISAVENRLGGNEITIVNGKNIDILNEETKRHLKFSDNNIIINKKFWLLYTSDLTSNIVSDIISNEAKVPQVKEVANSHFEFFKAANYAFGLTSNKLCPLT